MINYIMKNTDKLVCIQYDISKRFCNLANAIQERVLKNFPQLGEDVPALGQVI
ncbi:MULTISPECIES: hypothetical protein [Paenibacillus]|uniref:hypothetical protein n=1 Tax=Paenibacillus TaxID=44249 RepID=UPI000F9FF1A5|nr:MULTISPECIES: hypothetical protein [Paenibacillus]MBP1310043.1 hypothetical protein [Paenibacillus sp. 1182]